MCWSIVFLYWSSARPVLTIKICCFFILLLILRTLKYNNNNYKKKILWLNNIFNNFITDDMSRSSFTAISYEYHFYIYLTVILQLFASCNFNFAWLFSNLMKISIHHHTSIFIASQEINFVLVVICKTYLLFSLDQVELSRVTFTSQKFKFTECQNKLIPIVPPPHLLDTAFP